MTMNEARLKELASKILTLRNEGLPKTSSQTEIKYRIAVLSLCREIEGPLNDNGQIVPGSTVMDQT